MNGMARAQALLEQLALGAGLPAQAASRVRIIGADPVVRTVLRVGEAGAAAIAASGMAAAWLWFQKRGELQQVTVEVAAADLHVEQEELRFLQMLRDRLDLDKLAIAAIERSARVRYRTV